MEWRLIDTEINDAFYNMAVDEAIMKIHKQEKVPPTIRFYRWSPPALSLGYFQQFHKVVDEKKCRKYNVDAVRRLTGGRTILHDNELTYSITIAEKTGYLPEDILESYNIISRGIVRGFNLLDIDVNLKQLDKSKKKPEGFSAACFDAPSWYEVVADGKKLVGSAQTRKKGIILQHGSIPFTLNEDKLFSVLKFSNDRVRERMKNIFLNKATSVLQQTDSSLSFDELKKSLIKGWEQVFSIKLQPGTLLPEEENLVEELIENKYNTRQWNQKR